MPSSTYYLLKTHNAGPCRPSAHLCHSHGAVRPELTLPPSQRRCPHSARGRRRVQELDMWRTHGSCGKHTSDWCGLSTLQSTQNFRKCKICLVTRLWADRATAWTKFWRILKAVFFETASLVGRYLYMFTRKAKEKPQLCVQKFWEAFSPTPCGPAPRPFCPLPCLPQLGQPCEWGPHFRFSCTRSSDKGSALLRPLTWHRHDHARSHRSLLPAVLPRQASSKGLPRLSPTVGK